MIGNESDAEREFFLTGVKSYLDVEDAVAEFRRQVQEKCERVIGGRFEEIAQACQINWRPNDLTNYKYRYSGGAHVGKQLAIKGFGGLFFCLEVYRQEGRPAQGALVYLYRQRGDLATNLWSRLNDSPSPGGYRQSNNLLFNRPILEEQLSKFEEHLDRAVDDFVTFASESAGLRKHLGG